VTPRAKLHPVDPSLVPFRVGEKVAFREDHVPHGGMYGVIRDIGVDPDGELAFDLAVFDPFVGVTGEETLVTRSRMEDIQ
jgi:hypothetical protein